MKLGLIDADLLYHKKARFPNLALMKIAAKAKRDGAGVVLVLNESDALDCDALSASKVFTETKEPDFLTRFKGAITRGGRVIFTTRRRRSTTKPNTLNPIIRFTRHLSRRSNGARLTWIFSTAPRSDSRRAGVFGVVLFASIATKNASSGGRASRSSTTKKRLLLRCSTTIFSDSAAGGKSSRN